MLPELCGRSCTARIRDSRQAKLVFIRDTLHLSELYVSETLAEVVRADPRLTLTEDFRDIPFSEEGALLIGWDETDI